MRLNFVIDVVFRSKFLNNTAVITVKLLLSSLHENQAEFVAISRWIGQGKTL